MNLLGKVSLGFAVALALAAYYIQTFVLPLPFWFYLPKYVHKLTTKSKAYEPIVWSKPTTKISSKPNIVVIIADDLGYNDLFGGVGIATPNIESIAANGVSFTNSYAGHATCAPSRASIMTGRYPSRTGFEFTPIPVPLAWAFTRPVENSDVQPIFHSKQVKHVPSLGDMKVPQNETFVSELLVNTGDYSTIYIGKWHLGESEGAKPTERGFQESLSFLKGASLYLPLDDPNVVTVTPESLMDEFLQVNLGD